MIIAFYLENKNIPDIDLSQPEAGNPGCGGTEYLFVALPYYLQKLHAKECSPIILAHNIKNLPQTIPCYQVNDIKSAMQTAKEQGANLFIYRPKRHEPPETFFLIDDLQLPTIGWAHITPTPPVLRKIAQTKYFKSLVCVEHEQYDSIADTPVWKKMTYIVNGFDVDKFQMTEPPNKDKNLVVYLGALVPQKGFHILAKSWPLIIKRNPSARLVVIGRGDLYNHNKMLGHLGIAEKDYEDKFIIPHLCNKLGQVIPSVTFVGRLKNEKKDLLHKALIGVPNPSGNTENCPGSALEFQASKTAVVTRAFNGLMDTVKKNQTGLLGNSEKALVDNICYLLDNPNIAIELGKNGPEFIKERYNWEKVTKEWILHFNTLVQQGKLNHPKMKTNFHYHLKFLIFINRKIQRIIGSFLFWPSIIEIKNSIYPLYSKLFRR